MSMLLNSFRSGAAPIALAPNYFEYVELQLAFLESNGATSGADDSDNQRTWTASGAAAVQNGGVDFAGGSVDLAGTAAALNCVWNGKSFALEITVQGWPSTQGFIFDTLSGASANQGLSVFVTSDGSLVFFSGRGEGGAPRYNVTIPAADYSPNMSGENHIVLEVGAVEGNGEDKVAVGFNSQRLRIADITGTGNGIGDNTFDLRISGLASGGAGWAWPGRILNLRVWDGHHPYELGANATYTPLSDASAWPTFEVAPSDRIKIPQPTFFPDAHTAAAGWISSKAYYAEPRMIDTATPGERVCLFGLGNQHSQDVGYEGFTLKSTNYGRHFRESTAQVVATDASLACRNFTLGRDNIGNHHIWFRKADANDVSQGIFAQRSIDDCASWQAEQDITSLLTASTAGGPFGRGVQTSRGLQMMSYLQDFAEAAYFDSSTGMWGQRTTIYDTRGAPIQANEPFCATTDGDFLAWFSRLDRGTNTEFAVWQTPDAGVTVTGPTIVRWANLSHGDAAPLAVARVGNRMLMLMCSRSPTFAVFYSTCTIAEFEANPSRLIDINLSPFTIIRTMFRGSFSPNQREYGYPDIFPRSSAPDETLADVTWSEGRVRNPDRSLLWHATIDLAA